MTKTVTFEDAQVMLVALALEFPDRFVRRCTYAFDGGQPNCLIGVALARWGVPAGKLVQMQSLPIGKALVHIKPYVEFTADAVELLKVVQIAQDTPVAEDDYQPGFSPHMPWGEAVKRAFAQVEGMSDDGSGL